MYLQNEKLRVLLCEFIDDLVHLLAWFRPWSPKVDERDSFEIGREEVLEVFYGLDFVEVRELCGHGG